MHSDGDPDERPTFLPPEHLPPADSGTGADSGTPPGFGTGRDSGTRGGSGPPALPGDVPPLPGELPGPAGSGGRRDRSLLMLAGVAASVLVVLGTIVWWVASGRGPSIAFGGEDDPTPPPAETGFSPSPEPSESPTVPPIKPKVKGWQPVVQAERGLAYDVPGDWDVNSSGVIIGFEDSSGPIVSMRGSADYKRGFCPGESGSSLGGAGVAAYKGGSPAAQAQAGVRAWAAAGYTDEDRGVVPRISVGEPERVRVKGTTAYHAVAKVSVDSPGKCAGPRALVHAVAAEGGGAKGVFVLYADQGISGAVSEKTIDKILGSVRVYRP